MRSMLSDEGFYSCSILFQLIRDRYVKMLLDTNVRFAPKSSDSVEQRTRQHRPVGGPSFGNSAVLHTTFRSTFYPATIGPWPSILPSG